MRHRASGRRTTGAGQLSTGTAGKGRLNYLGHFLLTAGEQDLWVGGFLGDFARGGVDKLPERWRAGVRAHRRIDALTDAHPAARRSAARLRPAVGRWSGVAVDLLYDHVLASEWPRLAPEHGVSDSLVEFAARVYRTLADHETDLPPSARRVRRVMTVENWLSSYADLDAVARTLERMERRVAARRFALGRSPRPVSLAAAVDVFRKVPGTFRDEAAAVIQGVARDLKEGAIS